MIQPVDFENVIILKRMKIAIYHELPKGGARNSVNEIAQFLKNNNTVDLYTVNGAKEESGFYTHYYSYNFPVKKWLGNNWKTRLYKDTIELIKLYRLNKKISQIIQKRKYDILFVHASEYIEAPFILSFANKNKVFYLHDPYYRYVYEQDLTSDVSELSRKFYEWMNKTLRRYLDRANVRGANYVIANSYFTGKLFSKTYKKKATVIELGINMDFFKQAKGKKRRIDLLYIGSKQRLDGYDTYRKVKDKLGSNYVIRELLFEDEWIHSRKEMKELYGMSKVVLCLARREPLGLVPLEAIACGAIPVAVREGGYKETILHGQNGFLVKRDPNELYVVIKKLLSSQKMQNEIITSGSKISDAKWDLKNTAKKLNAYFESLD